VAYFPGAVPARTARWLCLLRLPDALRREADRFYVFFGKILPEHLKAVERHQPRPAS
jgi:hypothetical protein